VFSWFCVYMFYAVLMLAFCPKQKVLEVHSEEKEEGDVLVFLTGIFRKNIEKLFFCFAHGFA
jgi:hypothetical protein